MNYEGQSAVSGFGEGRNLKSEFQKGNTYFDGGVLANWGITIATMLGTLFTLFIALPWTICWRERWVSKHTIIDGRRLRFTGTGGSLFGKYIKWFLLSVITLLIYTIWVSVRMRQWTQEHTFFENSSKNAGSKFNGSVLGNLGIDILSVLVSAITFGIGSFWMTCYKSRWLYSHSTIEDFALSFKGTGLSLLCHTLLWTLLTIITIGIFSFWLPTKQIKWEVARLEFVL